MKRKMFTTFMVIGLILFMPSQASAITYAKGVILDGEQVKMEVLPVIENGRTLVPLRGLFESMEASVTWDQSTKTATVYYDGNLASVTIEELMADINGFAVKLDVPAKIINERTMVPLRFMAEALGYDVSFIDGWVHLDSLTDYEFYTILDEFDIDIAQYSLAHDDILVETTYNLDLNSVVISMTKEGLAKEIREATKDETFKDEWTEYIEYLKELSTITVDYFEASGYDMDGMVEFVDDENPDSVLLKIVNGVVVYDEILVD